MIYCEVLGLAAFGCLKSNHPRDGREGGWWMRLGGGEGGRGSGWEIEGWMGRGTCTSGFRSSYFRPI